MDWIIDTDMGLDDQISLLYLAELSKQAESNFNIKAILTQGTGLAHAEFAKANAVRLLRFAGINALPPVGIGVKETLEGFHQYPSSWRYEEDNLRGAILPSYSTDVENQNKTSSALLEKILLSSTQKVSILQIGTHSTIAQVLSANPVLANKVERIVAMIGAVDVEGNIHNTENKVAEFNAWIDPVAAKAVFASGIPITMVPLDVTNHAPLTQDFVNRFRASTQGPVANLLVNWWEGNIKKPVGEYFHWDPLATVLAFNPDLITRQEEVKILVNAEPTPFGEPVSVPFGSIDDFSLLNWQGARRSSLDSKNSGGTKRDEKGNLVNVVFDANIAGFEDNLIAAFSQNPLRLALISDTGGPAASATTFYYNVGSGGLGYVPTNSFGPGAAAVSRLVQSWNPSELLAIGDLAYNAGGSTLQDISIGQYYNNFIYPYPSPNYLAGDYLSIDKKTVTDGKKSWPYNVYNYPAGFPNPLNGGLGGSDDRRNHFWGALGNHDYGMEVGYGQVGVTPYNFEGTFTGDPEGPSSTKSSVRSAIDYFLPFLANPSLLGNDQARLNVGAVDLTGNRGAYYSMSFGGSLNKPLIEFFQLDTERLIINAGFEDWNPSGMKVLNPDGTYKNEVEDSEESKRFSLTYDPSNPSSLAYINTTTDLDNGYDQFTWLKESLAKSNATWKVITGHHPVYASGRWTDRQPDDHMSVPSLQRLLKALPEGSFDAYYNGHDHFYERVLESKAGGIGLGIPFITNGNSGRNLSKKIQVPYGTSVYEPSNFDKDSNPNIGAENYLLQSGPLEVAASGLSGEGDKVNRSGFSNGLYGYGFGATRVEVEDGYLLFHYEEAEVVDPAIANHLSNGLAPEPGFAATTKEDWIPNPNGEFLGKPDLARFELSITDGVVTGVTLVNGGRGYMGSKGGNYVVRGFNIYGNNIDPLTPWVGTAQVDLVFIGGKLDAVTLADGGRGYELAVKAAAENNVATTTADPKVAAIVVALNYNIEETQYLVRDNSIYNDWYLIADTGLASAQAKAYGSFGAVDISLQARSQGARDVLTKTSITTGYSGLGPQNKFLAPARGELSLIDTLGTKVGEARILNGQASVNLQALPAPGAVKLNFEGDALSSYQVNFRSIVNDDQVHLNLNYGNFNGPIQVQAQQLQLSSAQFLQVIRTDSGISPVDFGLSQGNTNLNLVRNAKGSSQANLKAEQLFSTNPASNWISSEGQAQGGAGSAQVASGRWSPTATANGQELTLESLELAANGLQARFTAGRPNDISDDVVANFCLPSTGIAPATGPAVLTVRRLSSLANGMALYAADPITGAVIDAKGASWLPGEGGYLPAALANAQLQGLVLQAQDLPVFGQTKQFNELPLNLSQNYGALLLVGGNGDDLISSFAAANPNQTNQCLSLIAPGRGISFSFEDLRPGQGSDFDFNDLSFTLTSAQPIASI
jgi:inosine-uridine nucleoside N-ribohydrolase